MQSHAVVSVSQGRDGAEALSTSGLRVQRVRTARAARISIRDIRYDTCSPDSVRFAPGRRAGADREGFVRAAVLPTAVQPEQMCVRDASAERACSDSVHRTASYTPPRAGRSRWIPPQSLYSFTDVNGPQNRFNPRPSFPPPRQNLRHSRSFAIKYSSRVLSSSIFLLLALAIFFLSFFFHLFFLNFFFFVPFNFILGGKFCGLSHAPDIIQGICGFSATCRDSSRPWRSCTGTLLKVAIRPRRGRLSVRGNPEPCPDSVSLGRFIYCLPQPSPVIRNAW